MSWRFRKVFGLGPFRTTLSKKGLGFSIGVPGCRYGISPDGRNYFSIGIPKTGLYYIKYFGKTSNQQSVSSIQNQPTQQTQQTQKSQKITKHWWQQKNISD